MPSTYIFLRDSRGRVSHRFDQPSNQDRLTADRSDEVEALWKSRKKLSQIVSEVLTQIHAFPRTIGRSQG